MHDGATRRRIKLSGSLDDRRSCVATSIVARGTPSAGTLAPVAEVPGVGDPPCVTSGSVEAAGHRETGRIEPYALVADGTQEWLGAAERSVRSADLKVEVRATGSAGVA